VIIILTYQDLQEAQKQNVVMDFVLKCINEHRSSKEYQTAKIADEYYRRQNTTIVNYQKILYTLSGQAKIDNFSPNYKLCSGFFKLFTTQKVQYLLSNGVSWNDESTADKLGKDFDVQLQKLARYAKRGGKAYGFWNLDHLDVFNFCEFKELPDENTGAIRAGVRFWQIDDSKPLRATLYEENGYTEYIWNERTDDGKKISEGRILEDKRTYKLITSGTKIDGMAITDGENYPGFPIVPLMANEFGDSELLGLRENIDCYDLIKSGFANTVDEASMLYWTISNAGGMDDIDLVKFIEHMKTVKAAVVEDDGAKAEAHTLDLPYQSREAILDRLEKDMYRDAMAFNPNEVIGGANTATQIKAGYESPDDDADEFEYQLIEFLHGILTLAGIDDEPTFTRSRIVNTQEEISTLLQAGEYLPADYITEKVLTLLGDVDKTEEVMAMIDEENVRRLDNSWTTDTGNQTGDSQNLSEE
jgi:SPP1 family phage portal protein